MPTTSNFGWTTPADTDYVKDGALAIRTLGNGIDTSFVDLKGGTTGQVLSKTSNTDLDFTWVTTDDANAIQNAIVDAKGDLITATAADTPARLAVGSNGDTLVADSSSSTGLRWQGSYAAGKNKIINGDFRINQRGLTSTTTAGYGHDRFTYTYTTGTATYSNETFTPGTAPVSGYEGVNFARIVTTGQSASNALTLIDQRVEDVRVFAGQTATISFWAKASSGTPGVAVEFEQNFGSGGSAGVVTTPTGNKKTISTSWARYSVNVSIPSVSGKTIGTSSYLTVRLWLSAGSDFNSRTDSLGAQNATIDLWGIQLEAGSVATAFQTATGTLQGENAVCERYFKRWISGTGKLISNLAANSTSGGLAIFPIPKMRTTPTLTISSAGHFSIGGVAACTAVALNGASSDSIAAIDITIGSASLTSRSAYQFETNNASATFDLSAEL